MSESRILVIDADAPRAERLAGLLEFMDLTPRWVASAGDVDVRRQRPHDWLAVVVGTVDDQKAADAFFAWLGKAQLPPPVLLLEGDTAAFAAAHGLHEAGVWTLESPIRHAQLEACLRRASLKRLDTEHQAQQVTTSGPTGNSPAVTRLRRMIEQVAGFDTTVLVLGESGTGKEVVARAIHDQSPRRDGPFVAINCGAIPPDLLESELFGHEKGAFTGALSARKGRFEMAEGGTLLLDEIGDMSLPMQVKLLRVLQEGEVRPVGASRPVAVDVRVIAATHRDLEQDVRSGRFREDLYYRIASMTLTVPPLRERSADVLPIADMLLGQACQELARPALGFSPEVRASLLAYPWPGNIRELKNEVYRAVALSEGPQVSAAALSCRVLHGQQGASAAAQPGLQIPGSGSLQERLDAIEAAILRETLLRHRWNKTHAAKELGLSRMGLRQKLARFGLEGQADG